MWIMKEETTMEYEKALAYSEEELDALDYLPGSDFSRDRSGVPENNILPIPRQ